MTTNVECPSFVAAIAATVRAALAEQGAGAVEAAAALDLDQEAVRRRLDASEPFGVDELERLAEYLRIDVQRIFDRAELPGLFD